MIKQFFAEPARLPVFRNRPTGLEHPEAAWWRAHRRLPVPSVPYPKEAHWIFVNGPVFPRNDRMFLVPAAGPVRFSRKGYERQPLVKVALRGKDAWVDRTLVFQTAPETLTLGLRTGRWPARFSLKIEGAGDIEDWMPPHSQRVLEVRNFSFARTFPAGKKTPAAFLLPMSTRSRLGPLWVTVLENSTDRALFERFGPEMSDGGGELGNTIDSGELARRMEGLTYLGDDVPFEVSRDPEPLPGSGFPLAAGPYVFTARLENRGDVAAGIRFALDDIFKGRRRVAEHTVPLAPGALETVTWRFEKKFAPYDGVLSVVSEAPGVFVDFWDLRPDAAALEQWRPTEPAALGPATADRKEVSLEVRYPGLGVLRRLRLPREWHSDGEVRYAARFDLDRNIRHKTFLEAVIFLHVLNEENKIVAALDYPLREASFSSSRPNPQFASSPPPGTYRLTGGIYNIRTRKRYRFDPPERLKFDPKRRYLELIPEIEVLPLRPERP